MPSPLRIVFAGTPAFAAEHLRALLGSRHEIVAVYSQPDRPAGRGKRLTPSPVKALALEHGLPVHQPLTLKTSEAQAELAALAPDLLVVVAYGLILPQAVLDIPQLGCVNVHASLLPRWRGAAPIERAIEAGDTESGVTLMQMDAGLDTGDMLSLLRCPITEADTGDSLRDTLLALGTRGLLDCVDAIAEGRAIRTPQDDTRATYASKITKADTFVDWTGSAEAVARRIRAFVSHYVCHGLLDGERVKLWDARAEAGQGEPGEILAADRHGLLVACEQGAVRLPRLQLPGGKPLDAALLLNAHQQRFTPGKRFSRVPDQA